MKHEIPDNTELWSISINSLVELVESLWECTEPTQTYLFTVGPIYGAWQFNVTRNWSEWMKKNLTHHFTEPSMRACFIEFLKYVRDNNLDVAELAKE